MKFDEFQCGFRIHCAGEFLLMGINLLVRSGLRNNLKTRIHESLDSIWRKRIISASES